MKKFGYITLIVIAWALMIFIPSGCKKEVGYTDIVIQDSLRHYYPLLQGQTLDLTYEILNIGKEPLVIEDIHPSCGCISVDGNRNNIILPGKTILLRFKYDSSKNLGYVEQKIYLFGNIAPEGTATLVFDLNVVSPYGAAPDYEETYRDNEKMAIIAKGLTNGTEAERGYWINEGEYSEEYSRTYIRYPWKHNKQYK